eukprot:6565080-Prymnesium_polylepis.1
MPQPLCDRCDDKHVSTECSHFKWACGKHADARCMPVEATTVSDRANVVGEACKLDRDACLCWGQVVRP